MLLIKLKISSLSQGSRGTAGQSSLEGALFGRRRHTVNVISRKIKLAQRLATGRSQLHLHLVRVSSW